VARAQDLQRQRAQPPQSIEVLAQPAGDEHAALAEHGVAGERRRSGHEDQVVVGVAGHGQHVERPGGLAVRQAGGRRRAEPVGQRAGALGVVGVVVREHDAARAPASLHLRRDRVEVLRQGGAGIDHPGGLAPHHPGVRAAQGQRRRVGRAHQRDAEVVQRHRFTRRYTGPLSDAT
jgi:hypothetical protein